MDRRIRSDRTAAGGLSQPFGPHLWYPFDFTQTVPVADNERYRQIVSLDKTVGKAARA